MRTYCSIDTHLYREPFEHGCVLADDMKVYGAPDRYGPISAGSMKHIGRYAQHGSLQLQMGV